MLRDQSSSRIGPLACPFFYARILLATRPLPLVHTPQPPKGVHGGDAGTPRGSRTGILRNPAEARIARTAAHRVGRRWQECRDHLSCLESQSWILPTRV